MRWAHDYCVRHMIRGQDRDREAMKDSTMVCKKFKRNSQVEKLTDSASLKTLTGNKIIQ